MKTFAHLLLFLLASQGFAQDLKPVAALVQGYRDAGVEFVATQPFQPAIPSDEAAARFAPNAQFLTVDTAIVAEIYRRRLPALALSVPYHGELITVDLVLQAVTTEDFSVITSRSGNRPVAYVPGLHYRGIVRGGARSMAAFSFFEGRVMGLFAGGFTGNMVLGRLSESASSAPYILYSDAEVTAKYGFSCGTSEPGNATPKVEANLPAADMAVGGCVRVFMEADYALFQLYGGSVAYTVDYLTGVFNQIAVIYANESISMTMSQVFVWETPDSYSGADKDLALAQFRTLRASFNGNLAQLAAAGGQGLGGVAAGFNGLCGPDKWAYNNVSGYYENVPIYSWDVNLITHEMGHNLGSWHTQSCLWPGGAIDNCTTTEFGCPPGPTPAGGGTIMSYCHLNTSPYTGNPNPGVDLANGFGPLPGNRIRNSVQAAGCLASACVPMCLPQPLSPADDQTGICPYEPVFFSWSELTGAINYRLYLDTTPTPGNIATVPYTYLDLGGLPPGKYYWQVRPIGPGGTASGCPIWSFTLEDAIPPTITCPPDKTVNNEPDTCGAHVFYAPPVYFDNCSATDTVVLGHESGEFFPVGENPVIIQARDKSGNIGECSFVVTVKDVQAPEMSCPSDRTTPTTGYTCSTVASAVQLGYPTISDNCAPAADATNDAPASYGLGSNTVTWSVADGAGNTATCTQTVTVIDVHQPVIECPATVHAIADVLTVCEATVVYDVVAYDNCGSVSLSYSHPPGSSFALQNTLVTVTATDGAGLTRSCNFTVLVGRATEICNDLDDDCDGLTDEADDWGTGQFRTALDGQAEDNFGTAVDLDGDYAIAGAEEKDPNGQPAGSAYIFHRVDGNWSQLQKLAPTGVDPTDGFGAAVAISGAWAVVGAATDDEAAPNAGAVYLFRQDPADPDQWNQFLKLTVPGLGPDDFFGSSVALHGDYLVAGAPGDNDAADDAGAVYVFGRNEGGADNWGLIAKRTAPFGSPHDGLGTVVDLDGLHLIAGAPGDDQYGADAGAAYVFSAATAWSLSAKLLAGDGEAADNFGVSVGLSGDFALVGATGNDDKGVDAGKVYSFYRHQFNQQNSWAQEGVLLDANGKAGDHFGAAVAIDEQYAAVGAPTTDFINNNANAGKVLVYQRWQNAWVAVQQLTDNAQAADDHFGANLALDGQNIMLGVPLDNWGTHADRGSIVFYSGPCSAESADRSGGQTLTEPAQASLHCYPVPFTDRLNIRLEGVHGPSVRVSVLNGFGQELAVVYDGAYADALHVQWDAARFQPGLYFVCARSADGIQTRAITLARR